MRLVPKELNFVQKDHRNKVVDDMISRDSTGPTFKKRIVTGNKIWVYEYDLQTSQQFSKWHFENGLKFKKSCQCRLKIKVMLPGFS